MVENHSRQSYHSNDVKTTNFFLKIFHAILGACRRELNSRQPPEDETRAAVAAGAGGTPPSRPPPLPAAAVSFSHSQCISRSVRSVRWEKRCRLPKHAAAGVLEGRTWLIRGWSPPCLAQPHPYRLARCHVLWECAPLFAFCSARVDHGVWAAASVFQPAAAPAPPPRRPRSAAPGSSAGPPGPPNALYTHSL